MVAAATCEKASRGQAAFHAAVLASPQLSSPAKAGDPVKVDLSALSQCIPLRDARFCGHDSSGERLPDQPLEIAVVDRGALLFREVHLIKRLDGLADVHRALFWIERAIRRKHDLVEIIEIEAGAHRR